MITRIELTNFMSHVHTVIEPAAGLTVLVGPNNCGKSAVVAALQILCRNDSSTYVLRHGTRECGVKIVTDDGHTIEWRRKNSPSYLINDQLFDRLRGSGLPDCLHTVLRLPPVDAGDDSDFDVHFGTQKSPIFLLGSSSANAAKFFASSSDAIRLVQMQKRHKEKLQDAQREKTRLEAESKQINAELAVLEPVVDLDRQVKLLEAAHHDVQGLTAEITGAQAAVAALDRQALVIARHSADADALAVLQPPPVLPPTIILEKLLADLPAASRRLDRLTTECTTLSSLSAAPKLFNVAALRADCERIAALERAVETNAARQHSLAGLAPAPTLADTKELATEIGKIVAARQKQQVTAAEAAALELVGPPPNIADAKSLAVLLRSLAARSQSVSRCEALLAELSTLAAPAPAVDPAPVAELLGKLDAAAALVDSRKAELAAAAAALDAAASQLHTESAGQLCPICGTPLDPERVLLTAAAGVGGHAHG